MDGDVFAHRMLDMCIESILELPTVVFTSTNTTLVFKEENYKKEENLNLKRKIKVADLLKYILGCH